MSTNEPASGAPEATFREIAADRLSGATDLTRRCAGAIVAHARETRLQGDAYCRQLAASLARVLAGQPSMAPLFNLANDVLLAAETAPDAAAAAAGCAAEFHRRMTANLAACAQHAADWMTGVHTVVTWSASSVVAGALEALHSRGQGVVVYCSESRPRNEGIAWARRLASAGIRLKLFTDAGLLSAVADGNLVLVGADSLLPEGVVNKVGTRPLAVCACRAGVPVGVAATREKRLPPEARTWHRIADHPPEDLLPDSPAGIEVVNPYFEVTPYALVTRLIDESGVRPGNQGARQFSRLQVSKWLQQSSSH